MRRVLAWSSAMASRSEGALSGEGGTFLQRAAQRAVREQRQRLRGVGRIGAGPRQRFGQRAVAFEETHRPFEIARALLAFFERAAPEAALLRVAAGEGDQDRQRDLAVAEIVADGFAEFALPRRKIEHVVDQLIGDTKIAAEAFERRLLLGRPIGEN